MIGTGGAGGNVALAINNTSTVSTGITILSGANTYTDGTAISAGLVRFATTASVSASATTSAPPAFTVWNVQFASQSGIQITTTDNFIGPATENTANSTWNRVASVPQTAMALKKNPTARTPASHPISPAEQSARKISTAEPKFSTAAWLAVPRAR